MATLSLCDECAKAAGVSPSRAKGPSQGCDACAEQHRRAAEYDETDVVAGLVSRMRQGSPA